MDKGRRELTHLVFKSLREGFNFGRNVQPCLKILCGEGVGVIRQLVQWPRDAVDENVSHYHAQEKNHKHDHLLFQHRGPDQLPDETLVHTHMHKSRHPREDRRVDMDKVSDAFNLDFGGKSFLRVGIPMGGLDQLNHLPGHRRDKRVGDHFTVVVSHHHIGDPADFVELIDNRLHRSEVPVQQNLSAGIRNALHNGDPLALVLRGQTAIQVPTGQDGRRRRDHSKQDHDQDQCLCEQSGGRHFFHRSQSLSKTNRPGTRSQAQSS